MLLAASGCGGSSTSPVLSDARLWPTPEPAMPAASAALASALDGTDELSLYRSHLDHRAGDTRVRALGAFGLGNRVSFATVGLTSPLNTVHGAMGPGFQKELRFFGDHALIVADARTGAVLPEQQEWAGRLRGTAVNRSFAELARGVVLETVEAAPWTESLDDAERRAIVRWAVVSATRDVDELELVSRATWPVRVGADHVDETNGERTLRVSFFAPGTFARGGEVVLPLGALRRGQSVAVPIVYAFARGRSAAADLDATLEAVRRRGIPALLAETRERWRAFTSSGAEITTPDPRVNDLIDGMKVTLKVQQSYFGASTPMSLYTNAWLRDTVGPVRFLTRIGNIDDAWAALDYYYAAALVSGDVTNSVPLGRDPALAPPPPDWASLPVFDGRERAESPSYQVLVYHRMWKTTGSLERVAERWGFLRRCLDGQAFEGDSLLPFGGDETFRVAMAVAYGLNPVYLFEEEAFSVNSVFLFVAASEALAEMGEALGRAEEAAELRARADQVRAATERNFHLDDGLYAPLIYREGMRVETRPFEDVSLKPFWTGFASADDEGALANLARTLERIGRPGGIVQSPLAPSSSLLLVDLVGLDVRDGTFTGMVPGYTLHELAVTGHPDAPLAFDHIDASALSSGNWGEYMVSDDLTALSYHDATGAQGNYTARYRPWEGGINLDATLTFLLGLEPDAANGRVRVAPRLPNGWPRLVARDLPLGDGRYDLEAVRVDGDGMRVRVTNRGARALRLDVELWPDEGEVAAVTVDGDPVDVGALLARTRWGRTSREVTDLDLDAGARRTVTVRYTPR